LLISPCSCSTPLMGTGVVFPPPLRKYFSMPPLKSYVEVELENNRK
jgi:hypothetical protein